MNDADPKFNADRATFSLPPELMKSAQAKAKSARQKFSTYIAGLVENDVTGGGSGKVDDLLLRGADDLIYLRQNLPLVFAFILKTANLREVVLAFPALGPDDLVRVQRSLMFLEPAKSFVEEHHLHAAEDKGTYDAGKIPNSPVADVRKAAGARKGGTATKTVVRPTPGPTPSPHPRS